MKFRVLLLFTLLAVLLSVRAGNALTSDEIAVIANDRAVDSLRLARFYMEKRGVPSTNLIRIRIDPSEGCSRDAYDTKIAAPVRSFLESQGKNRTTRCLVTMYGVPLVIRSPHLTHRGQKAINALEERLERLRLSADLFSNSIRELRQRIAYLTKVSDMRSAVDSELSLVLHDHPLPHWLDNPLLQGAAQGKKRIDPHEVLLVSRLDAARPDLVEKIITDALEVEKRGLRGAAFFDARWPDPGEKQVSSYQLYDRLLHRAAAQVEKSGMMEHVEIDDREALYQPGPPRRAALYCGWYSLGNYIDAFIWQPGAVGYHIASSECTTLKKAGSRVWCKMMLEKGAAATIGPVGEPYLNAFPPPDIFFSLLCQGRTLVESYFGSLPHLSWKMVLVGDPLYRPFAVAKAHHPR